MHLSAGSPGKIFNIEDNSSSYPEIIRSEIYVKEGEYINEISESSQRPACFIYKCKKQRFRNTEKV